MPRREVLVTGATGYIASRLIPRLLERGHAVRAFVRESSRSRVPPGAGVVVGDALDRSSIAASLQPGDTLVQLVGTPHPSPAKAAEFERVDLVSVRAAAAAARDKAIAHVVYVSVAQPAPVMQAFLAARAQGEGAIRETGLPATFVRPWYVLGPGHRWAYALVPVYAIARMIPATREGAARLGPVTIDQMLAALVHAVENPPGPGTVQIVDVRAIRQW
jgi:uncharacterized protein YbjT (DUF2867 family)